VDVGGEGSVLGTSSRRRKKNSSGGRGESGVGGSKTEGSRGKKKDGKIDLLLHDGEVDRRMRPPQKASSDDLED